MKLKVIASVALVFIGSLAVYLLSSKPGHRLELIGETDEENEEMEENEAAYQYLRWKYEADMIKDPGTGQSLFGLRDQEIELAGTIPQRNASGPMARLMTQNNYIPAGPNNNGGRTRALAYDIRYNGSTNKVLLSGGVSGGIFRSADGGATWTRVTPANEVHNVATIAQDPRPGNQDTW